MKRSEVLLDPMDLNKMAIVYMAVIGLLALMIYSFIWGIQLEWQFSFFIKLCVLYIVGIVLHESFHAVGFFLFGKAAWDDVEFGLLPKHFVPYVHCKIPLAIRAYRIALLLPIAVTGILPLVIGMMIGKGILVFAAVLLMAGGIGDWLIFQRLRSFCADAQVEDHASAIGCIVYEDR